MIQGNRKLDFHIQLLAVPALLLLATPAWSGLGNCSDRPLGERYSIYFDRLRDAGTGSPIQRAELLKQFVSTMNSHFIDLNAELQKEDARLVEVVQCDDVRSPGAESDFNPKEIKLLDDHRVILEVWGSLNPSNGIGSLGYVLVPRGKRETPAVYVHGRSLMAAAGLRKKPVFRENPELMAYAHIVLGIRFFNNQDYSEAESHLCRGKILLEKVVAPLNNSTQNSERMFVAQQQRLIGEVQGLATEAVSRSSPNSGLRAALGAAAANFQCPALEGN